MDDEDDVEIDDAFDLLGFDQEITNNDVGPNQRPTNNATDYMPGDNDSISTFGGNQGGAFVKGFNTPVTQVRRLPSSNETSSTSTLTMSVHNIETVEKMQQELADMKQKLQLEITKNEQLINSVQQTNLSGLKATSSTKIGSSVDASSEGGGTKAVSSANGLQ